MEQSKIERAVQSVEGKRVKERVEGDGILILACSAVGFWLCNLQKINSVLVMVGILHGPQIFKVQRIIDSGPLH